MLKHPSGRALKDGSATPPTALRRSSSHEPLVIALNLLAESLDRMAAAVAPESNRRYKRRRETENAMISEPKMAALMHIKPRTLGTYRRKGKLPGCWVRNGRKVLWHVELTLEAWNRGIA